MKLKQDNMKKFAQTKLGYGNPKGDFWFI